MRHNLGDPNTFFRVTAPFEVLVQVAYFETNTWARPGSPFMGPVYRRVTLQPGDEIHNLYGGRFVLAGGDVKTVSMKASDKHPFERGPGSADVFPLDKMERIDRQAGGRGFYPDETKLPTVPRGKAGLVYATWG